MDNYVTGAIIQELRKKKGLTQGELAEKLNVSDKAVSKWETGKGLPDISMLEPLAEALSVSMIELLSGEQIVNKNKSANLLRSKFYVCPICGNVVYSAGDAVVSCCGITLPPLEAETADDRHKINVERVEDEFFISVAHPMEKAHYISFIAFVSGDKCDMQKLYPEGNAETRLSLRGGGFLYIYCNKHGLMRVKI